MKYIKRFKVSSDYDVFKNSNDYIEPNVCVISNEIDINPIVILNKSLFPYYINLRYHLEENNSSGFIIRHVYESKLDSPELYDTLYKQLYHREDGAYNDFEISKEFLMENPIYLDGHQILYINTESNGNAYGVNLYWSASNNYPGNLYGSCYNSYHYLGPNNISCFYEELKFPNRVDITVGEENEIIQYLNLYLNEKYSGYDFNEIIPITENLYINGDKIVNFSKEFKEILYRNYIIMKYNSTESVSYFGGENIVIRDIKFPIKLSSIEGKGDIRNVKPCNETKDLIAYLNYFAVREDNYYYFGFDYGEPFLEIDGIELKNPQGYMDSETKKLTYINIHGGWWGGRISLDGSIEIWNDE
jgi:hypothetical protein